MIDKNISSKGSSWEEFRKEKFSLEERRVLDKEVAQINEKINKSNR